MKNLWLDKSEAKRDKAASVLATLVVRKFRKRIIRELSAFINSPEIASLVTDRYERKQRELDHARIEAQLQIEANNDKRRLD